MNQNGYVHFCGTGSFCVCEMYPPTHAYPIEIEARCGDPGRKGTHHYFRWQGITIEQARLLANTLLSACDEIEAEANRTPTPIGKEAENDTDRRREQQNFERPG